MSSEGNTPGLFINSPGYLQGIWNVSMVWDIGEGPIPDFQANLLSNGSISVGLGTNIGVWIQGGVVESPRVSVSILRMDSKSREPHQDGWLIFEGTANDYFKPTIISGSSFGYFITGNYYRGSWGATLQ